MQNNQFNEIQKTLVSALGVRYHVTSLLDLAHEITLVSMNAKISSAQIGDAGKVFGVMTNEITDISAALRATVQNIRTLTQEWTKIIAIAAQQMRYLGSLDEAIALGKAKNHSLEMLEKSRVRAENALKEYDKDYPRLVRELVRIIDGMEKSLKIVNYVKIGILIESERLRGMDGSEKSPFQHLANEIQSAADEIRVVSRNTMRQLKLLTNNEV